MLDLSPDPIVTNGNNYCGREGHLVGARGAYTLVGDVRVVAICKRGCSQSRSDLLNRLCRNE